MDFLWWINPIHFDKETTGGHFELDESFLYINVLE